MTLNGGAVDENRLISLYLREKRLPEVYTELGRRGPAEFARPETGKNREKVFPADFILEFDRQVNLRYAGAWPGVKKVERNVVRARVGNAEELMGIYQYAGLLIVASGIMGK
jgi:hypothetical protein